MGKKFGKGLLARALVFCLLAVSVSAAFPTAVMATAGDFNTGDIAVINAIIDNNGLGWTKDNVADGDTIPVDWTGVIWSADNTNKRITSLNIGNKNLTGTLDVSGLSALTDLACNDNQLTALNISANASLKILHCYENNLTSLDISANAALVTLQCSGNQITTINISNNPALLIFNHDPGVTIIGESPPPPATSTPDPAPTPEPTPAPPAAAVDLAPPAAGEGGTAVPANTNLVAVAASGGDVDTMAQLVAARGITGNLVQTLDIKLFDAAGSPINGACTIRVNIPGLTAADRVTILHRFDNGTTEQIAAVERDGYCTFRVSTFSLFGVVVAKNAGGTTPGAPQTGVYL